MDEILSALTDKVEDLLAQHAAFEAVFLNAIAPVLMQTIPTMALDLVEGMRTGLNVTAPPGHSTLQLKTEEHIQSLADRLDRLIRAPTGAGGVR
jgi:hypothetical protein